MVSFMVRAHVIEIVCLNIPSKCITCKYMCIQCAGANDIKNILPSYICIFYSTEDEEGE